MPALVVARSDGVWTADLNGNLARHVVLGDAQAVAIGGDGTLWVGTRPDASELDAGWYPKRKEMCGYTAIWGPWPSAPIDLAQIGATWSAQALIDAQPRGPSCEATVTPGNNLAYTGLFWGSGTSTTLLSPGADTSFTVSTVAPSCWTLTFSHPSGPVACFSRSGAVTFMVAGRLGHLRRVGPMDGSVTGVGISPKGKRLAFVRYNWQQDRSLLMTARLDGSGQRTIARLPAYAGGQIAWSPDGKRVFVQGGTTLWSAKVTGRSATKILTGVKDFALSPRGAAMPPESETPERSVVCAGAGATAEGATTFPEWMNLTMTNATSATVTVTITGASTDPYTWILGSGETLGDWSLSPMTPGVPISVSCGPGTTVNFTSTS